MKTIVEKQQKSLLKKYHTLCSQLGLENDAKRDIIHSYGVESSRDLSAKDLMDICTKLEQTLNPQLIDLNVWRKRLIASIGAWLKAMSRNSNINIIKAIAIRASGKKYFNEIPLEQLRSLYNAFNRKKKDMEMVEELTREELDYITMSN